MPEPANATAFDPCSPSTPAPRRSRTASSSTSPTPRAKPASRFPSRSRARSGNAWSPLPEGYRGFQDESGRLWDVLWMAHYYAVRASNSDRVRMCVLVRDIRKDLRDSHRPPRRHFPIVAIGAGDDGGPVITVMFPEDD